MHPNDVIETAHQLTPLHDRVIVDPVEPDERVGSLYVPESAREKPQEGIVRAVGPGDDGGRGEMSVSPGDRVLYAKHAPMRVTFQGEEVFLLRDQDILARID